MVQERLEAAKRFPENQDPTRQFAIQAAWRILQDAGVKDSGPKPVAITPESSARPAEATFEVYPEISLEREFSRQASLVRELARILGIKRKDILLPVGFPARPEEFDDTNSVPIIAPRFKDKNWINIVDAKEFGVSDYLRMQLSELSEWENLKTRTPNQPYATWLYIGDDYREKRPDLVRGNLPQDLREGTHWDGLGLAVMRPDVIQRKWFEFEGSIVGRNDVPYVNWWGGHPSFSAGSAGNADPYFRSLVAGSPIETLTLKT